MSSRPILPSNSVITNGDMSADITSKVSIMSNVSMLSYDISWTGTSPIGVAAVQVSNTYQQNMAGGQQTLGNWTTIPLSVTNITGNSGTGIIEIPETSSYAIRLIYTRTSGTGTMQATIHGKVR